MHHGEHLEQVGCASRHLCCCAQYIIMAVEVLLDIIGSTNCTLMDVHTDCLPLPVLYRPFASSRISQRAQMACPKLLELS